MKLADYGHLFTSYHQGWDELRAAHPDRQSVFYRLVLPLSLLPALMILYAGFANGALYAPALSVTGWLLIAAVFLAAELGTVTLMGWIVHQLTERHMGEGDYDGSTLLAAIAAVPMWLSSLTLFVPSLPFNIACAVLGLIAACALVYHGLPTMVGEHDKEELRDTTYLVMWFGVGAWAVLSMLILLLMLAGDGK
ncbi:Yip1 family protein [Chitinolyticbacter meiyuanensis]|uniref:Yip1 family protein n=1 Tax=Chitinolyticbacter meiyuanensis TaxID=682798 RepID=UPI0016527E2E|nr:Yip1 family protein [Chitinolyticbacter meiyuanensis]